ncbi:MAG TPA: Mur ligase family protein [Candidatus Eisenbacteria bacterium]|nr:Mur ligase family protein [Candidatus Eisenbacteria bacterium]
MFKKLLIYIALWYLKNAARIQLAKIKPKIIGVAGSSGKSSLSNLIFAIISEKFVTKQSQGKNSETGLPLDILDISMKGVSVFDWIVVFCQIPIQLLINWKRCEYYIAEMGIDGPKEPKNMSYLLSFLDPIIGIVTNVSLEHSVYFEPYVEEVDPLLKTKKILDLTAEQETMLLLSLPKEGTVIVNLDDVHIARILKEIDSTKITVSLEKDADLQGKDIDISLSRFRMIIAYAGKNYPLTISQPLPRHFAYEFLFALGVGVSLKIPLEECITLLEKHFSLPNGRLSFFKGIKNTTLIDSTYNNATLPPILDILDFVKMISGDRRKIAIIGDMRELGDASEDAHRVLAKKILQTVDYAIVIGPLSEQYIVPILREASFSFEDFPDVTSSKEAIVKLIKEGDVILIKGSQNTLFLERVVEMLLADKKDAIRLTRRGEFWDKKRLDVL